MAATPALDTFSGWARSRGGMGRVLLIAAWAAALALGAQSLPALRFLPAARLPLAAQLLEALLAAGFLAATLLRRPRVDEARFPRASKAVRRFHALWRLLWAAALLAALAPLLPPSRWTVPAVHAFDLLRSALIFLCFLALYRPFSKAPPARRPLVVGLVFFSIALLDFLRVKTGQPLLAHAPRVIGAVFATSAILLAGRLAGRYIAAPLPLALAAALWGIARLVGMAADLPWLQIPAAVILPSLFFLPFQWLSTSGTLVYSLNKQHDAAPLDPRERRDFVGWIGWPLPPSNTPSGVALSLRVVTAAPMNAPLYFHIRIKNNTGAKLSLGLWSLHESFLKMDMGKQMGLDLDIRNPDALAGIPNSVSIEPGCWEEIRVPFLAWNSPASMTTPSVRLSNAKSNQYQASLAIVSATMSRLGMPEVASSNPAQVEVGPGLP